MFIALLEVFTPSLPVTLVSSLKVLSDASGPIISAAKPAQGTASNADKITLVRNFY